MKKITAAVAALLAFGCASGKVSIKPNYDFSELKSVAVLAFSNPKHPKEAGVMVADIVSGHLVESGLNLIERNQLETLLSEQKLSTSGAIAQAATVGKILGVDAVVMGTYRAKETKTRTRTVQDRPVRRNRHGRVIRRRRGRGRRIRVTESDGPLEVIMTARMVLVETGAVLWVGSASAEGDNPQEAFEEAAASILKPVSKAIHKSFK